MKTLIAALLLSLSTVVTAGSNDPLITKSQFCPLFAEAYISQLPIMGDDKVGAKTVIREAYDTYAKRYRLFIHDYYYNQTFRMVDSISSNRAVIEASKKWSKEQRAEVKSKAQTLCYQDF